MLRVESASSAPKAPFHFLNFKIRSQRKQQWLSFRAVLAHPRPSRLSVVLLVSPREPESLPITVATRINAAARAAGPRVDLHAQMAYQFASSPRNHTMWLALRSLGFDTTCVHSDPLLEAAGSVNLSDTAKA